MDRIASMSVYSDVLLAMEAIDSDIFSEPDVAIESIESETRTIEKYFTQRSNTLYSEYAQALEQRDYDAAIKALDKITALCKQCKEDMSKIPPEDKTIRNVKTVAKLLAIVAAILIAVNIPQVEKFVGDAFSKLRVSGTAKYAKTGSVILKGFEDPTTAAKQLVGLEKVAKYGATAAAGTVSAKWMSAGVSTAADIYSNLSGDIDFDVKQRYKDDPNAVSRAYLAMMSTLDTLIARVSFAKMELKKEKAEWEAAQKEKNA